MTRLRTGCIGLNLHLSLIGKVANPECDTCDEIESVSHYVLHCSLYEDARAQLFRTIARITDCPVDLSLLLGVRKENVSASQQRSITNAVGLYVQRTRRFHGYYIPEESESPGPL